MILRCGCCRAARSSFTAEQCAENVAAVIEGSLQHIPRKWGNVQALFLRTAESAALPIYQVRLKDFQKASSHACVWRPGDMELSLCSN